MPSPAQSNPPGHLTVTVNERPVEVHLGTRVDDLRRRFAPGADLLVHNGFPVDPGTSVADGDAVVLITRGEIPARDELDALMRARHGPGIHERVRSGTVGIAGCGGLGSTLAVALARTGVGTLVVADFDVVEPSNLNRQQFSIDQIGRAKVDALADNLAAINPFVSVVRHRVRFHRGSLADLFAGCDVVAECVDDAAVKREVLEAVRAEMPGTPLVTVSGIAGIGPSDRIRVRRVLDDVWMVGDGESAARPGRGLLAPRVTVAAGHQANAVLRLLMGRRPDREDDDEDTDQR